MHRIAEVAKPFDGHRKIVEVVEVTRGLGPARLPPHVVDELPDDTSATGRSNFQATDKAQPACPMLWRPLARVSAIPSPVPRIPAPPALSSSLQRGKANCVLRTDSEILSDSNQRAVTVTATMHIFWYTVLNKVRRGRAQETAQNPLGLLPHPDWNRTRQGLAERAGKG